MAASGPRAGARRPRRGSLERPVNGRMYRGTWLLVGLPLLLAAFSVAQPDPLPQPAVPATFDGPSARILAEELARTVPDRSPGSPGALHAVRWVRGQFALHGFGTRTQAFEAELPGRGRVTLRNVVATVPGPGPDAPALVVVAHRDNLGVGPGANDNASGTAAMLELARAYARAPGSPGGGVRAAHQLVFVSTDGGAYGSVGSARLADDPLYRDRIAAVVVLDSVGAAGRPRLELAGDEPRSPAPDLVATAERRILEESGSEPDRPSALRQLVDLGVPASLTEQAPFVGRAIPAVTLTSADGPQPHSDTVERLSAERIGELGRAAQQLLAALDEGFDLSPSSASYVWLGPRLVRGWAIELVLIAATLPFLAAAVDLFARCRRRRIPLAPALRAYRSRLGFWLLVGLLFAVLGVAGAWPDGVERPLAPSTDAATEWPVVALGALGVVAFLAWLVARERLIPRRRPSVEEELAGYTAGLLALGALTLVVVALNPFALLFLLPSLHAWIWLPQLRGRSAWARAGVLAAGFAGPALLVLSFATRDGLGADAPWYLLTLAALGVVDAPHVILALVWAAAAAQLAALAAHRYAPFPGAGEHTARGPLRGLARRAVLAVRGVRRRSPEDARALEG